MLPYQADFSTNSDEEQDDTSCDRNEATAALNLQYLVASDEKKNFSWLTCFFVFFFVGLVSIAVLLIIQHRVEPLYTYHRLKSGETLISLAQFYYGDPKKWKVIFRANRSKFILRQKMIPGDVLKIPKNDIIEKSTYLYHCLKANDSLRSLAQQYYGDSKKWKVIFRANSIKFHAQHKLTSGDILKIPKKCNAVGG